MKNEPVVIERILKASPERVWKAITDKDHMKQLYLNLAEFKPEIGFEFSFEGGPDEETRYLHLCKITRVEYGKTLQYTWRFGGLEGNSLVTFELFPEGNNTKLRLTHEGIETFPSDKVGSKEDFAEGWVHLIESSLKSYLEKTEA
jgi:uncharacterized protein YndB with AHSA1/START domain